ncbi:MAG: TonB-dependent receptor [bacterium]|nr:TonB-dependent receptor [bacterium]
MLKVATVRFMLATAFIASSIFLGASTLYAQGVGTIQGRILDKKSKTPLAFANVVIVGSAKGAMSLDDGQFTITGVPVGTYKIKAMMMGYKTVELANIVVNGNQTTEVSFRLEETIVAVTQRIDVYAERKLVEVTSSDVRASISAEQVKDMPVDNAIDAIALKTGIVKMGDELHARGGRAGEIQTQIDGVPVDDPLGTGAIRVGQLGEAGAEIISGGMDAEYGNAQSGIINITTKEGGSVFGGELRYFTDDFGRADKTYTNYDRISIGLGGPTPWRSLRYYVSAEGTFQDGENVTIRPREEHRLNDWFKLTERQSQSLNLQTKLTWNKAPFKLTGEAIVQRSKFEDYEHNWNVEGFVQKVYYFQRLIPAGTGANRFTYGGISIQREGPWLQEVAANEPFLEDGVTPNPNHQPTQPHPRTVIVEQLIRNPDGSTELITEVKFRGVDLVTGETILWDENLNPSGTPVRKPWVLFEGFQFPFSRFSNFQDDTSYVFFNSAERTPDITSQNLQLKIGFNHNIRSNMLYSINVSRLEFNRKRSVNDKGPAEYSSAGLPTTLPDGTFLQGGISQAIWYTDPGDLPPNAYFVTAYDYPRYSDRKSVQWLLKSDVTSEAVKGHRMKAGLLILRNDLDEEDRFFPAQTREDEFGQRQQGLSANVFNNVNWEGAVYAQDKWEYEGMVVNAGLRFEFFETGNVSIDINSEDVASDLERFKWNWSPRLGMAFPITDRDKFFFHYGRFTQWPSRAFLFRTQDAIGAPGTLGNPNLGEELTISYQAGIAHQFSETVVGNFVVFNKDIFGLISSTRVTDDSTGIQSFRFINKTYASSRGLEISLEKRLTRRFGFEAAYTYAFADGVASDSDFGRSADGLTHLPTEEQPLNWDQRHTFNLTARLRDRNNWGATAIYQFGSGLPWTPVDRFARLANPLWENTNRFDMTHRLSLQARKKFNIYGRELTLYFDGRNLLDQDIPLPGGDAPLVFPLQQVAGMDGGSYLTETNRFGGAYLQDIDDDGRDDFIPVHDPTVFENHRIWRIGFGFEF